MATMRRGLHWWSRWRPCAAIVNLHGGAGAVQGVLWQIAGEYLVVKNATLIRDNGGEDAADGEILIHRAQVSFIQLLPPGTAATAGA